MSEPIPPPRRAGKQYSLGRTWTRTKAIRTLGLAAIRMEMGTPLLCTLRWADISGDVAAVGAVLTGEQDTICRLPVPFIRTIPRGLAAELEAVREHIRHKTVRAGPKFWRDGKMRTRRYVTKAPGAMWFFCPPNGERWLLQDVLEAGEWASAREPLFEQHQEAALEIARYLSP